MSLITIYIFIFGVSVGIFILLVALIQIRKDKKNEATGQGTADATTADSSVMPAWAANLAPQPAPAEPEAAMKAADYAPEPPPIPAAPPATSPSPTQAFSLRSGPVEVARLIRAPDGTLILEANGNWYTNRDDVADPKVLAVLAELERFLNSDTVQAPAPLAGGTPPAPTSTATVTPTPASQSTTLVDGKPAIVMTAAEAAQLPLAKPSMDIFRQMRTLREMDNKPQIKIKTMIEEIDEVLQAKVRNSPLAGRGLKVSADADGGALFLADGQTYASVDQVPDAEARALIQAAIKEWERK
jgi:hypothetical protein